jgi:hypothetical protein
MRNGARETEQFRVRLAVELLWDFLAAPRLRRSLASITDQSHGYERR